MSSPIKLKVRVIPNARKTSFGGEREDELVLRLNAPALEGKANAALRSFLANELKIPERTILLKRGQKSREKIIRIEGLSEQGVRRGLLQKCKK